ncbi:hypothetical protein BY996DRAFT_6413982 [Phakopsora pachyrhizi]|nr:hypothetical protein BY996DRAFT_6413982 [Phakopsora pachyrhizi]
MWERLKKKGREGKMRHLAEKARFKNLELAGKAIAPELNGGDPQEEELSTNLEAEGKEYEDTDGKISNGLVDPNPSLTLPSDLGSLIGESMKGRGGVNEIVILPPSEYQLLIKSISPDLSHEELEKHCKQVEVFDYLALLDPHTGKKLHWVGWVTFLPDTDMKEAKRTLSESKKREREIVIIRPVLPLLDKNQKEIIMGDTMLISPVQQVSLVMMGQHRTPDL